MIDFYKRANAFKRLSDVLLGFPDCQSEEMNEAVSVFFQTCIDSAAKNVWFTRENVDFAVRQIGKALHNVVFENWPKEITENQKTVAVVINETTPFSGFADMFYVLMAGNRFLGKLSDNDTGLLKSLADLLCAIEPGLADFVHFTKDKIPDFDAIVVNGDKGKFDYLEKYLGKRTHIINRRQSGVAVMRGDETTEDFERLAVDVFTYFGLADSSVRLLFVPENFDFTTMLDAFSKYGHLKEHSRYFHNYEYVKSICLVDGMKHFDNGFLVVKESEELFPPTGALHFIKYCSLSDICKRLENESINCIVSKNEFFKNSRNLGEANQLTLDVIRQTFINI